MKRPLILFAVTILFAACAEKPAPVQTPPFKPVASIQEIMQSIVDPSADGLWEAFSTTVTKNGSEDKRPLTDAEWTELRHLAIRLVEASNLLIIDGRQVAHPGRKLEDDHVKNILTAPEIQRKIDADLAAFFARAQALQQASQAELVAIDARDAERVIKAGGQIDEACERCHKQYWYPNDRVPTR